MSRDTTSHPSPVRNGGVVFYPGRVAWVLLVLLLGHVSVIPGANAEVYLSTQRVADRMALEQQKRQGDRDTPAAAMPLTATTQPAEADPETAAVEGKTALRPPPSDFDDAVRPLLLVHVGHGRLGYDRGHLPGAVYLDVQEFYVYRDGLKNQLPDPEALVELLAAHGIGPDTDLVLYGDAAGIFPARVYVALSMIGLDQHAYILDGQLKRWVSEGRGVSTEAVKVSPATSLELDPSELMHHSRVVRYRSPEDAKEHGQVTLFHANASPVMRIQLDARSPRQFAGKASIKGLDTAGHISGAVNLPWQALVPDAQDPVLASDAGEWIRQACWQAIPKFGPGIPEAIPDDYVIGPMLRSFVYDETGNQAAVVFTVLRHFGMDAYFDERGIVGYVRDGGELVTGDAE